MGETIIAERENKTVYKKDGKTIKIFTEGYPKSFVMNEALNQAIIEEEGLNVPRILEIKYFEGKLMTVSSFVEGKPLDVIMKEQPEREDEFLEMFVRLQLEIQSKTTNNLTRLKDKLNLQIKQADLPATVRYDYHNKLENMPRHHKICHGDFNPSNVIVGDDGKLYVLDWSHATQGNGSGDAAMTFLLFMLHGEDERAAVYIEKYCRYSGVSIDNIRKWIPMVAAAYSTELEGAPKKQLLEYCR